MERRNFIKNGLGLGGAVLVAPAIITSNAVSKNNIVKIYAWSDYFSDEMIADFEKSTGFKAIVSTYGSNDEVLNKLRASKGKGFDIILPTHGYGSHYYKHSLLQPIDESRVNMDKIKPSMLEASQSLDAMFRRKRYLLPFAWGTEAITVNTDKVKGLRTNEVSFGRLWEDDMVNKVTVRAHSSFIGAGLYLDSIGKISSNRLLDTYKDEKLMRKTYGEITDFLIGNKKNIKQFWSNAQETINAFQQNNCAIGQTWDGPAIRLIKETNGKIKYLIPKEGGITWLDGIAIPVGAENLEGSYAWLNWIYNGGKTGAMFTNKTGYNSCAKGAENYLIDESKRIFKEIYAGDALEKLWWYPAEPTWFVSIRNEFRDKLLAAEV